MVKRDSQAFGRSKTASAMLLGIVCLVSTSAPPAQDSELLGREDPLLSRPYVPTTGKILLHTQKVLK